MIILLYDWTSTLRAGTRSFRLSVVALGFPLLARQWEMVTVDIPSTAVCFAPLSRVQKMGERKKQSPSTVKKEEKRKAVVFHS